MTVSHACHSLLCCLIAAGFACFANNAWAGLIYDEAVDGDLSGNRFAPSVLAFGMDENIVCGSVGPAEEDDIFTFTLPENTYLTEVLLLDYSSAANTSFLGVQHGDVYTSGFDHWGYVFFGQADIGSDLLVRMAESRGQFDVPLGPGCGKTAISLAAAAELNMPLIQFDVGSLMSKWVGESEANCRTALQQIEAMAPCVVQMDEVEKGFGSVGHDGDSGASMRTFGTVLKWLSERTCCAYVIMTANNVQLLPPEFTRKGRFDELYGVYLPTHAERQAIFGIHLAKRKREPDQFDLQALGEATDGYTGADIEQVVITGLKAAFHAGTELTTEHLLAAVPEVRPLSQTDPERVAAITEWLTRHATAAGKGEAVAGCNTRRIKGG